MELQEARPHQMGMCALILILLINQLSSALELSPKTVQPSTPSIPQTVDFTLSSYIITTLPQDSSFQLTIPKGFVPIAQDFLTITLPITNYSYDPKLSIVTLTPKNTTIVNFNVTLTLNTPSFQMLAEFTLTINKIYEIARVSVTSCSYGQYYNGTACQTCSSNCSACFGKQTYCTWCTNQILRNGICGIGSPDGMYSQVGSGYYCSNDCLTCQKNINNCTSCINTKYLLNNTCQLCNEECIGCNNTSTNCLSCAMGFNASSLPGPCKAITCDSGYFLSGSTCQKCSRTCLTCLGTSTNCLSCAMGFNASSLPGPCKAITCDSGYFLSGSTCQKCSRTCLTCRKTSITCTSCLSPSTLVFSTCQSCPPSLYLSLSNLACEPCSSSCLECSSITLCSRCKVPLYLFNSSCHVSCPPGTFVSIGSTENICSSCSSSCLTCIMSSTNCTSCNQTSSLPYLDQSECVATCPITMVPADGICRLSIKSNSASTNLVFLPASLTFLALAIVTILSRVSISKTLMPSCLCAFSGFMENLSWLFVILLSFIAVNTPSFIAMVCVYALIIAGLINFFLNTINIHLFRTYVFDDEKFRKHYKSLKNEKFIICMFYLIVVLSLLFSHKFIELLFSNLCKIKILTFKVKSVYKLNSQKYIRFISLLPSLIAIGSSTILFMEYRQTKQLLYWEGIDVMIINTISAITSIWVTKRRAQDFQITLDDKSLNLQDFNVGDDPAPEIHFQPLRKDDPSFQGQGIQSYKHSVNITEEELMKKHDEPSEDQQFYNEIHVAAREKDDHGELHETRINSIRKSNESIGNSKVSDSIEEYVPAIRSLKQVKQRRPSSRSRSKNKCFIQKEERKNIHWIEKIFTPTEIQFMKIIKKTDEVALAVSQTIKEQLRTSQHRLQPNGEFTQICNFIMNLSDNQVGVLNKETRVTLQAIQQSLLRLQAEKIPPEEFLEYLRQAELEFQEMEKENRSMSPMPPLPKHLRAGKRRNRSNGSSGSLSSQGDALREHTPIYQSPNINEFVHSPAGHLSSDHQEEFEQFSRQAKNVRSHGNNHRKTPHSYQIQDEIKQSENEDAIESTLRPYQAVSYFNPMQPRCSSAKKRPAEKEEKEERLEIEEGSDEVHLEDGLSSLKKQASELKDNAAGSPEGITLSRLQQLHQCNSFTYNEQIEAALDNQAEFPAGQSVAQVMGNYSKNGSKQDDGEDIADEAEDRFKRIRGKRHVRKRAQSFQQK